MFSNTHHWLCRKQNWYDVWHQQFYHHHVHAAALLLFLASIVFGASFFVESYAQLTFDESSIAGSGAVTINGAPSSTVSIGTTATTGAVTIGSATSENVSITDNSWNITTAGAAAFSGLSLGGTALTATGTELNYVDGVTSAIQTQLDAKAPAANPTFTGTVTLPTGGVALASIADDSDNTKVLTAGGSGGDPHWAAAPSSDPTASGIFNAIGYGDGSDGDLSTTGDVTLTGDKMYHNVTINNGHTMSVGSGGTSYRLYVSGALTINAGGTISNAGSAGTNGAQWIGGPGGNSNATAQCGPSSTGGMGNSGGGGSSSTGITGFGGQGGAGGAGSTGAGGTAGTVTAGVTPTGSSPVAACYGILAISLNGYGGGTGGGGGAGGGSSYGGGGGGGGGGIIVIVAHTIINNGTISSPGGAGGNAAEGGNPGGGGGGGGGFVLIVSSDISGSGTISVPWGTGGSGYGTGSAGSAGSAGTVMCLGDTSGGGCP